MKQLFCLFLVMRTFAFSHSSLEVFKQFPNKVFVETGTFCGDGIQLALDSNGFENIVSIQLSKQYYFLAKKKFRNKKSVKLVLGDSSKVLGEVIKNIDCPITFWLDGHYSGAETSKGEKYSPILDELDQIKNHPIKNHTILIDDVRDFGTINFDYITKEEIEQKLRQINPSYHITYMDCAAAKGDILVAHIEE